MKKKCFIWAKKYKDWTREQWRKVLFSDESHFLIQGVRSQHVRIPKGAPLKKAIVIKLLNTPKENVLGLLELLWGWTTEAS